MDQDMSSLDQHPSTGVQDTSRVDQDTSPTAEDQDISSVDQDPSTGVQDTSKVDQDTSHTAEDQDITNVVYNLPATPRGKTWDFPTRIQHSARSRYRAIWKTKWCNTS